MNQVFFISTTRELSVHRKDLRAPTLAGPSQLYQGSRPLAVLHFYNWLFISWYGFLWFYHISLIFYLNSRIDHFLLPKVSLFWLVSTGRANSRLKRPFYVFKDKVVKTVSQIGWSIRLGSHQIKTSSLTLGNGPYYRS